MNAYILIELKTRLSYCIFNFCLLFSIFFIYSEEFLYFILKPNLINFSPNFIFTQLNEVLWVFYKLTLFGTLCTVLPFLLCQFCLFLIPGLYKFEVKYILTFISLFLVFNYMLLMFFWYYIFPFFCNFLLTFEQKNINQFINIFFESRLKEYLGTVLTLYWYLYLISFIMLIFLVWCLSLPVYNIYKILQKRKYIYLFLLILIANLIAFDFISTCIIFIFIISFFEIFNFLIFVYLILVK